MAYEISALTNTDIYKAVLPMINSGGGELLDQVRLIRQLTALERSKSRSGTELISHPPGQHDDVINSAAGALVVAAKRAMLEGYQESTPPAKPNQKEGRAMVEIITRCYATCRQCGSQHLVDKPGDEPDCPQRGWTFGPAGMRYYGSGPRTIEGLP